jgi:hypothetical protein
MFGVLGPASQPSEARWGHTATSMITLILDKEVSAKVLHGTQEVFVDVTGWNQFIQCARMSRAGMDDWALNCLRYEWQHIFRNTHEELSLARDLASNPRSRAQRKLPKVRVNIRASFKFVTRGVPLRCILRCEQSHLREWNVGQWAKVFAPCQNRVRVVCQCLVTSERGVDSSHSTNTAVCTCRPSSAKDSNEPLIFAQNLFLMVSQQGASGENFYSNAVI